MTQSLTLAHISDLHLAPIEGFSPRYWNIKRGLGYLNWQRGRRRVHKREVADALAADIRAQAPDHIAVSGDLANLGLLGEYARALLWLEALGDPARVSVVPGNHDIYTSLRNAPSCLELWSSYMQSDVWGAQIAVTADETFPFVRRIGFAALIGVNSAVPTPPFVAAGQLGTNQMGALAAVLDRLAREGVPRIVMIHHPPFAGQAPPRRRLRDAAELSRVLEQHGAELILHGHNHTDTLAWLPRPGPHVPALGVASGSAARAHKDEPLARYNLVRLTQSDAGVVIEVTSRGLAVPGTTVVELTRRVLVPAIGV
jgi:3',5'-cyclic AMP phosphodiesterase CpdA